MFAWYQSYDPSQDLPEDDRLGIQTIYGSNAKQWGVNPARPQRPATTSTTTTTTTTPRPPPTRVFYPERNDPGREYPERKRPDHRNERRPHYHPRHNHTHQHHNPHHPHHHHPSQRPKGQDEEDRRRIYTDRRRVYTERPTYTNSVDRNDAPTRRPYRPSYNEDHEGMPDQCDTSYDAITIIRGQLFIFKNKVCLNCFSRIIIS